MNAVNLIPLERRRAEAPPMPGAPFLGLLAALVLALAATVVYVGERNQVSSRQSELVHLRAGAAEWSAAAARYAPAVDALRQRAKGFTQLGALFAERYDWEMLLGQIAGVMPKDAELSTLAATAAVPVASGAGNPAAGGAAGTTGTASGATASGTSTSGSGITLSGCAVSEPVVADTMVALRRLTGVSEVSLVSSSRQTSGSGAGASTGSGSGAGCGLPVTFSLSLAFAPTPALLEMPQFLKAAAGAGTARAGTPAPAGSSSDSTGAPEASSSDTTGASS